MSFLWVTAGEEESAFVITRLSWRGESQCRMPLQQYRSKHTVLFD